MDLVASIFLALELVLFCFSFLFFLTIVRFRHIKPFNSSFYQLSISYTLNDLVLLLVMAAAKVELCTWSSLVSKATICTVMFLTAARQLGLLVLAVNRLSSIVSGARYNVVWRSRTIRACVALQWFLPAVISFPVFVHECYNGKAIQWKSPLFARLTVLISSATMVVCTFGASVLYAAMLILSRSRSRTWHLCVIAAVTTILMFFVSISFAILFPNLAAFPCRPSDLSHFFWSSSALLSFSHPLLLTMLCERVRFCMWLALRCRSTSEAVQRSSVSSNRNESRVLSGLNRPRSNTGTPTGLQVTVTYQKRSCMERPPELDVLRESPKYRSMLNLSDFDANPNLS